LLDQRPLTLRQIWQIPALGERNLAELMEVVAFLVAGGYAHPAMPGAGTAPSFQAARQLNLAIAQGNREGAEMTWLAAPAIGSAVPADLLETLALYGENGLYIFALPKGATEVRLVSRSGAPADARPWLDDRRCLGVNVERIVLRGASEVREVPVDHPDLSQGWQAVERDGAALRRWTSGEAVLPLPALRGPTMLEIRAGNGGMAYVTNTDQERRAA
jgi:hypothetical protein